MLSFIDKVRNIEGKRILLGIICTLCDNINTTVEIGKLNYFKFSHYKHDILICLIIFINILYNIKVS